MDTFYLLDQLQDVRSPERRMDLGRCIRPLSNRVRAIMVRIYIRAN